MSNNTLIKCGFLKDENNLQLLSVFQDGVIFEELYIDIYSANPVDKSVRPMLMLRHCERDAIISKEEESIIVKRDNKYDTYVAELSLEFINESFFKESLNYFEFILNYQNVFYKLTIFK